MECFVGSSDKGGLSGQIMKNTEEEENTRVRYETEMIQEFDTRSYLVTIGATPNPLALAPANTVCGHNTASMENFMLDLINCSAIDQIQHEHFGSDWSFL